MKATKQLALIALLLTSAALEAQDKTVEQLKKEANKTITKDAADKNTHAACSVTNLTPTS